MLGRDSFTRYYAPLLDNAYDVVDRIIVNGYFGPGCTPGGFRKWWQDLHGTFDNLDDTHLMRMAGRFSRRVRGWAKTNGIPVLDCKEGQRKHRIVEEHIPSDPKFRGIFAVIVARMPAPVWKVLRFPSGGFHIKRKQPMPFVNHYFFHIMDAQWGHVTIAICGHPPFRAIIMLNGHEYVACRARRAGIKFAKEGNCFTEVSNAQRLAQVADALRTPTAIGQLAQVCERWIYHCLCFGLSFDEQKQTGFRYRYSVYQMEYSRNLLFHSGRRMEEVFDGVIDRSRARLDIKRVLKIFGRHQRRIKGSRNSPREQLVLETPVYDLTVFKLHFGLLTLKIYTKGERVLRCEAIAHHIDALNCGRALEKMTAMIDKLSEILTRFLESLYCVDMAWLGDSQLDELPKAGMVGSTRVGGIDVNRPRMRAAMHAALALTFAPDGFTAAEHAGKFRELLGQHAEPYSPRQAAYDLKKLRAKGLLEKTAPHSRRYRATSEGLRTMAGLFVLREKVLRPLLRCQDRSHAGPPPNPVSELDTQYDVVQCQIKQLLKLLHFAA
jgi:hypothetical protein